MYSYEHNLRDAGLANPELRPYLDWYIRGHNIGAAEKARLFRLVWSLAGDSSGSRQELYKRWHRGDIVRNCHNLSLRYDRSRIVEHIRQFIRQLLCRLDPLGKAHGTARAGW
jgi:aromatic ring hydroxylase